MEDFIAVALLRSSYNSTVVILGSTCLGIAAGVVGTLTLLRKRALLGDALAHCSLPGLCCGFLTLYILGYSPRNLLALLFGAAASGLVGIGCIQFLVRFTRLREDAVIGAVLSVFFGFGVLLLSIIQYLSGGQGGGLHHFIYGQTATMRLVDAYLTIGVALCAVTLCILLLKEFRLICFDTDFANAQGWPVSLLDLTLMTIIVVVTTVGLQSVGLLLVVALLIIPAASARFWTERLTVMVWLAGLLGGISGYFGAILSSLFPRFPAGAVIVLTSGIFFIVSFLFAPSRGLLAAIFKRVRLRFRVIEDHCLRELFERHEKVGSHADTWNVSGFHPLSLDKSIVSSLVVKGLVSRGIIEQQDRRYRLTPLGFERARPLVRNHRLWEEYLIQYADIDALHVDRSADLVEHVLTPEVLAQLEQTMRGQTSLDEMCKESVHPLVERE